MLIHHREQQFLQFFFLQAENLIMERERGGRGRERERDLLWKLKINQKAW
jgi:hypothetical protein